ncbi:MAG TPA: hypothetical protein V6C72_01285 [Chroococcales cyanobacterium]
MQIQTQLSRKLMASALALSAGLANVPAVLAQESGERINANTATMTAGVTLNDIDSVTTELVRKEIELARLTTTYRLNNVRETKLHKWVTAGFSTCAYAVADAGNIVTFTNAFKYQNQPQNLHIGTAEAGPFLIFLGELLFVGRTVTVAALDAIHDMQIHHRRFDRKTFEQNASRLETEIHALIDRRKALIATSSDPAYAQEQKVLEDLSNGLSAEFVRNYARASRIRAFHLTDNIVANYTSMSGAFIGGLLIYLAASNVNPRMTGPAGIGFCISGTGFILKDFLARRVAKHIEKKTSARLLASHGVHGDPIRDLETDNAAFGTVATGNLQKRKQAYDLLTSALLKDTTLSKVEDKEEFHKYLHDQTINAAEGLANIAAGSILAQGGFSFHETTNPLLKLDRAQHFLAKFGAAAITFTPTASGGLVDTPVEAIYGEYKNRKDCRENVCPKVGLKQRMDMLDQAEVAIR